MDEYRDIASAPTGQWILARRDDEPELYAVYQVDADDWFVMDTNGVSVPVGRMHLNRWRHLPGV